MFFGDNDDAAIGDGKAFRVARSKIALTARSQIAFWRDAARLFATQAARSQEIDDLADYLAARVRADAAYSLKGRTLVSLRRASDECVFMLLGRVVEHRPTADLFVTPHDRQTADYIEGRYG